MRPRENAEVVLAVFRSIEQCDAQRFTSLLHPEFEIRWPPSLPELFVHAKPCRRGER